MKLYGRCRGCNTVMMIRYERGVTDDPLCGECPYHLTPHQHQRIAFLRAVAAGEAAKADTLEEALDSTKQGSDLTLGAAAKAYARVGWLVFPLAPGGKLPAISRQQGGHGFQDATTDADQIDAWWKRYPQANIGVATGHKFDVIDVDYEKPGAAFRWADIRDQEDLEVHALALTPHGLHAYVMPGFFGGVKGNLSQAENKLGIDYRGLGGYVVVPPSVRPDGRYEWWSKPSPRLL